MNGISGISFQQTAKGLSVHVYRSNKSSSRNKKKRLPYSFKQMSKQISQAKTARDARPVVTRMQTKLAWLYRKLKSGEYGESEVFAAILHAAEMERIAKRKVRHLEQEEAAEQGNGATGSPGEEDDIYGKDELVEAIEENEDISEQMMKEMMEEIKELEEGLTEEMLSEMQDMAAYAGGDLSEEEIDEMKRKHRSDEERQLTRADLKYLKALFDRLEQEKRAASSSAAFAAQFGDGTPQNVSLTVDSLPAVELADPDLSQVVDVTV